MPPVGASLFGNSEHGPDDRLEKVSSVRLASVACMWGERSAKPKHGTQGCVLWKLYFSTNLGLIENVAFQGYLIEGYIELTEKTNSPPQNIAPF